MMYVALAIGLLTLGSTAGWAAGRLLRRRGPGRVIDSLQGCVGGLLFLEVFALTGPLLGGPGELALLVVFGAWVAVGISHVTAALMRSAGLTGGSG